jgi:DNA sulfur modification protein DndE
MINQPYYLNRKIIRHKDKNLITLLFLIFDLPYNKLIRSIGCRIIAMITTKVIRLLLPPNLYKRMLPISFFLIAAVITPSFAQQKIENEISRYVKNAPFQMEAPALPKIPEHKVTITDFGAVGNGHILNTNAINKAINSCADAGGGTVIVPPGLWLTGPIEMKSHINLHLAQGAILLFSPDHSLYPFIRTSPKSDKWFVTPPIYGYDLSNIAITGKGIINGSGDSWRPMKKEKATASQWKDLMKSGGTVSADGKMWWPTKEAMEGENYLKGLKKRHEKITAKDMIPARDFLRPNLVSLMNCSKVLIDGVTLMNPPKFTLNPRYCRDLVIRRVKINNEWYAQNADGIDLSNCSKAVIYQCTVNAGDDGICMKSSRESSDKTDTASLKNIIIADNIVYHAHGGFVIGSNTDGGMENIFVHNCNYINTDVGIRIKSARDRGGLVHNIYISDIYMANIATDAVLFNTYYENKMKASISYPVTKTTPRFENFFLDNIYCDGAGVAISLTGLPEMPLNHLYFKNINITAGKGFSAVDTSNISLQKVIVNGHEYNQ